MGGSKGGGSGSVPGMAMMDWVSLATFCRSACSFFCAFSIFFISSINISSSSICAFVRRYSLS